MTAVRQPALRTLTADRWSLIPDGPSLRPFQYGYIQMPDGIFFLQDFSHANVARRARTGDIVLCEPSSRDSVFIAGDFSDWQLHALSRSTRNSWQFGAFFEACVFHPNCTAFKFVMNRDLWIEPATFAENVIDAGVGDPSIQNLTLSLCENVVERGHRGDR